MDKTVLVIDRDHYLLGLYANSLAEAGLSAHGATTGREGLMLLDTHNPHLILMDIVFRDMSGMQFLQHIYSMRHYKKTPIVLISNYNTVPYQEIARDVGIRAWLQKSDHTANDVVVSVLDVLRSHPHSE